MGGTKEERTFVSPFYGFSHRSVYATRENYRIIGGKLRMKKLLSAMLCIIPNSYGVQITSGIANVLPKE